MSGYSIPKGEDELFSAEKFEVVTLDDEIAVDDRCRRLLRLFYLDLVERGRPPKDAGTLAWGADYFLREFVIPDRRENLFALPPGRVRQFAGHWYIVKNMEPNMVELGNILDGIDAFYAFAHSAGRVSGELLQTVQRECADRDFYRQRIEDFWSIEKDGFEAWERACPLKE